MEKFQKNFAFLKPSKKIVLLIPPPPPQKKPESIENKNFFSVYIFIRKLKNESSSDFSKNYNELHFFL